MIEKGPFLFRSRRWGGWRNPIKTKVAVNETEGIVKIHTLTFSFKTIVEDGRTDRTQENKI